MIYCRRKETWFYKEEEEKKKTVKGEKAEEETELEESGDYSLASCSLQNQFIIKGHNYTIL